MPRRSGAEAQQRPYLLGNHLLVGVSQKRDFPIGCGLLRRAIFYAHLAQSAPKNQSKTQRILPMHADRFSQTRSSSNDRDASTIRGRGALRIRPLHRSHETVVGRSIIGSTDKAPLPYRMSETHRLAYSPNGISLSKRGAEPVTQELCLHATDLSTKRLFFKGRHHFDGLAHIISILDLVNVIARFR